MTQSHATFKSFEPRPGHTPCRLPALIDRLAGGLALPAYFGLDDLREMSKFLEIPNVHGLAAYPIERPARAESEAVAPIAELPAGVERPFADRLESEPLVMARGKIGVEGGEGMLVQAIVPQTHAHLAAALKMMLFPWPENENEIPEAGYTLLIWPMELISRRGRKVVEEFTGHWPETDGKRGTGLIIGCDDPGLIVKMIEDSALRHCGKFNEKKNVRWAAPLMKAEELAKSTDGQGLALNVESWIFGVESDGDGHFPVLEGRAEKGEGWVLAGEGPISALDSCSSNHV